MPKIEKKKKLTSYPTEFDEEDGLNVESFEQNLDENGEFASYEDELAQPLNINVPEILVLLKKYVENFPYHIIPHITKLNEINDVIHNYNNSSAGAGAL